MTNIARLIGACVLLCLSAIAFGHTNQDGPSLHGNNGHGNNGFVTATWEAAIRVDADVYVNTPTKGHIAWGVLFSVPSFDVVLSPGDEIVDGIFWAPVGLVVEIIKGDPCPRIETLESMVIGFGPPDTLGGSVTCQPGFYACCFCFGACTYGKCYANGTPIPVYGCQFGGPGTATCSISRDDCNAVEISAYFLIQSP